MAWALQAAWAWLLWGITVLKLISGFLSSWGKKYLISKVIVHIIQVLKFTSTALQSAPLKTFPLQGGYLPFFSLIFGSLYFLTLFPSLITVDHDLLFWFSIALSSVNELHCALVFWFKFSLKLFILISSAVGLTALSCATDFTPSDGKWGNLQPWDFPWEQRLLQLSHPAAALLAGLPKGWRGRPRCLSLLFLLRCSLSRNCSYSPSTITTRWCRLYGVCGLHAQ